MNFSAGTGCGLVRSRSKSWRVGQWVGFFALSGILSSCQTSSVHPTVSRGVFRPDNVFAYPPKLSLDFRRVAVLPLGSDPTGNLPEGCTALTPGLWEQLAKTKAFEVVAVNADHLRQITGRSAWTGREVLPADFLPYLRREYECDGVLFVELTTYRAYAPLAVGWRFKLVDARSGQILWAADELFDATSPAIERAAQRFEKEVPLLPLFARQDWAVANSPRRFGRYSVAALLDTLPER